MLQQASLWTNKIYWKEHMESILKWTYDIFSAFTCYTDAHIKNAYSFKKKIRSAYLHVFPMSQNLWFLAARTLGDHLWHTALAVSSAVPPTCSVWVRKFVDHFGAEYLARFGSWPIILLLVKYRTRLSLFYIINSKSHWLLVYTMHQRSLQLTGPSIKLDFYLG